MNDPDGQHISGYNAALAGLLLAEAAELTRAIGYTAAHVSTSLASLNDTAVPFATKRREASTAPEADSYSVEHTETLRVHLSDACTPADMLTAEHIDPETRMLLIGHGVPPCRGHAGVGFTPRPSSRRRRPMCGGQRHRPS